MTLGQGTAWQCSDPLNNLKKPRNTDPRIEPTELGARKQVATIGRGQAFKGFKGFWGMERLEIQELEGLLYEVDTQ